MTCPLCGERHEKALDLGNLPVYACPRLIGDEQWFVRHPGREVIVPDGMLMAEMAKKPWEEFGCCPGCYWCCEECRFECVSDEAGRCGKRNP